MRWIGHSKNGSTQAWGSGEIIEPVAIRADAAEGKIDVKFMSVSEDYVIANGAKVGVQLPCTLEHFLKHQGLLPRSVVVEHNQEAVAPSEFSSRTLASGDRLEIVRIVAGG